MELFESPDRLLAQEWLHIERTGERVWLSTVWLGFDHNPARFFRNEGRLYGGALDDRPWIFETMCFSESSPWNSVFAHIGDELGQWRYATMAEAVEAHYDLRERILGGGLGV